MSKGGGQGSFAQMQGAENQYGSPRLEAMDMGGFGGGGPHSQLLPFQEHVTPVGNSQNFSSGIGGKGGQLAPQNQGPGSYMGNELVPLDRNPSMINGDPIASDLTGFIPGGDNLSTRLDDVIGGEGLLYQLQPIDQPVPNPQPQPRLGIGDPSNPMLQELRPLPRSGGFEGAMGRFNNLTTSQRERLGDLGIDDIFGSGAQRATNIQTQGPESMPRPDELFGSRRAGETSMPAPPIMTGGPVAPGFTPVLRSGVMPGTVMDGGGAFGSGQGASASSGRTNLSEVFNQNRGRLDDFSRQANEMRQDRYSPPRATPRFSDEEHSRALTQAREILGIPSGGQPQPAKNNEPRLTAGIKPQPSDRVYAGGTPNFDERTGQYRQQPSMPRSYNDGRMGYRSPPQYGGYRPPPRPPVYGQQRFPFPYGQPRTPGRNTQFNMPFMPQSYGRMNPYAGQFGGYGVPSNVFGFGRPHYQPYAPPTYAPSPAYTPPPPAMQLPPGTGMPTFYGGGSQGPATIGGGIGGFGRYNLGLAGSQLR